MVKGMRKNNTKKMGMGLTTLALITIMAIPVSAGNTQSGYMSVKTTVESGYTLTVPKDIVEIPFKQENTELKITVSGKIEEGKAITVTTQDGALLLGKDTQLPYTIIQKELTWNEAEVNNDGGAGVEKTTILNITQDSWKEAKAGNYVGTVTFTAEMK